MLFLKSMSLESGAEVSLGELFRVKQLGEPIKLRGQAAAGVPG